MQEVSDIDLFSHVDYPPEDLSRIGSDKNCSSFMIPHNGYVKEVIVWGDEEHVAGIAIMDNHGRIEYYGSNFHLDTEYP